MIVKVDGRIPREILERLIKKLEEDLNVEVYPTIGKEYTILGLVGDTSIIDIKHVSSFEYVVDVQRIQEPFKRAGRHFKPEDTIVTVGGTVKIGGTD